MQRCRVVTGRRLPRKTTKAEVASDLASLYDRAEEGARGWLEGWGGGQAVWKISKILSSLPSVPTGL